MTNIENRYLLFNKGYWHYQRRVPSKFKHIETRSLVRGTLGTTSLEIARLRRDALVAADDHYWTALALEVAENDGVSKTTYEVEPALRQTGRPPTSDARGRNSTNQCRRAAPSCFRSEARSERDQSRLVETASRVPFTRARPGAKAEGSPKSKTSKTQPVASFKTLRP